MINVYIILSESKSKKSSVIRSLTGAHKSTTKPNNCYIIELNNRNKIRLYVSIPSLQQKKISPDTFIRKINQENNKYKILLIPLHIYPTNNCPEGCEYIKKFIDENWNLRKPIILGTNNLPNRLPLPNLANYNLAHKIKKVWHWK